MPGSSRHISVDAPISGDDDSFSLLDMMVTDEEMQPDLKMMEESVRLDIMYSLNSLAPRGGRGAGVLFRLWKTNFDRLRPVKTSILHGLEDTAIAPEGSRRFVEQLRAHAPSFPVDLQLIPGDHRLSGPEHIELLRRLVVEQR